VYIGDNIITAIDAWLDSGCGPDYHAQPLAQDWARLSKVSEELGEATAELILHSGQNPRKPRDPDAYARMLKEIADVVCAGIVCLQHFTKDAGQTSEVIYANLRKIVTRSPEIMDAIDALSVNGSGEMFSAMYDSHGIPAND
jgi:hypothetical protein